MKRFNDIVQKNVGWKVWVDIQSGGPALKNNVWNCTQLYVQLYILKHKLMCKYLFAVHFCKAI